MSILAYVDFAQPFRLHTDACGSDLGAILSQTHEGGTNAVIAYASRSLTRLNPITPPTSWNFLPSSGL